MNVSPRITGMTISPIPFAGTIDEKTANYETHRLVRYGYDSGNCERCGSEMYNEAIYYQCGADIPHQVMVTLDDGRYEVHNLPMSFTWDDITTVERKYT